MRAKTNLTNSESWVLFSGWIIVFMEPPKMI